MASFRGPRAFLSNFYPSPIMVEGTLLPTVEHGYVFLKTLEPVERCLVVLARTPGDAKRLGRKLTLRHDWEVVKLDVMRGLLRQKFQHAELAEQLLATGDEELVEDNDWGDTFWGRCRGEGLNWLGRLLMEVRAELQQEREVA